MKKVLLGLLAATLLVSNNAFARIEYEEVALDVEEEMLMDQRLNEARKQDRQAQEAKEQKSKMMEEERARQKAAQKEKNDRKMRQKEEAVCKRNLDEKAKKMRRTERLCQAKEARQCKYKKIVECQKRCVDEKADKVRCRRQDREEKLCMWEEDAEAREARENASGMYADLYMLPAWPMHALFWEGGQNLLNVTLSYEYATDCYDSNRSGSKSDITRLAFGESPITVQNILLASKLVAANPAKLVQTDPIQNPGVGAADEYLRYLANEVIAFNGRAEQYGVTFNFGRYILCNDIAIGVELPVLYKRNRLRMHTTLSDAAIEPINTGAFGPTDGRANAFLKRYGADPVRFVNDVLSAKGINNLGGSTTGLGDVAVFINGQFNSCWFEKAIIGIRGQFATGKKASQSKLWAPDLGNGGFTEIMPFASIFIGYNQWINPHFLGQVSFSCAGHVDRRIPRKVTIPAQGGVPAPLTPSSLIALGDRVSVAANTAALTDFDSTVNGFSDTVTRLKLHKGVEFKFRIGNLSDGFIGRRGSLNLYYDFRAKQKDKATGLDTTIYNTDSVRVHTNELEHRAGLVYSYQPDLCSRLNLAMAYTFAGMNVPKTFDASGSFNYAF